MSERRDHHHLLASSGYRHIQPAASAFGQQGAKTQRKIARAILAVTDADDDRIALITLDPLQVLYKEPLSGIGIKDSLQLRIFLQFPIERGLNPIHVFDTHGDDSEGFTWALAGMTDYKLRHLPDFGGRAFFLAIQP